MNIYQRGARGLSKELREASLSTWGILVCSYVMYLSLR